MKTIKAYKSVYNRKEVFESDLDTFINEPHKIAELVGLEDWSEKLKEIRSEDHKPTRNELKRAYLPAVNLNGSGYLSIDIDGISHDRKLKDFIIEELYCTEGCYACMDSVSGNLVAFFKYEVEEEKFKYLYYKLWLQLTLSLGVNIDFLPEKDRLRYLSDGEVHFCYDVNESNILTEYIEVKQLPYIKSGDNNPDNEEAKKIKRDIVYKSE